MASGVRLTLVAMLLAGKVNGFLPHLHSGQTHCFRTMFLSHAYALGGLVPGLSGWDETCDVYPVGNMSPMAGVMGLCQSLIRIVIRTRQEAEYHADTNMA